MPLDEILKAPLSTLAQAGLLGALLLIVGAGFVWLLRISSTQWKTFAADLKDIIQRCADVITNNSIALSELATSNKARALTMDASVQASQIMGTVVAGLTEQVRDMKAEAASMRADLQKVRDALMQSGLKL